MLDPRQLYTVHEDVLAGLAGHRPVLVHQLDGFVDAGQAGRLLTANLIEQLDSEVVAVFDHDQLHDYRSRRPAMIFDTNQWRSYADLQLRLLKMTDEQGEVFLLFSGPEPDVQWERLAAAVIGLIEQLDVRLTITLHGIPMAVPHSRPITATAHATDPELVAGLPQLDRPGRGAGELHRAAGVPARPARPQGDGLRRARAALPGAGRPSRRRRLALTRQLSQATGLAIPLEPLEEASASNLSDINTEMAQSSEVQELVATLEQQYDAMAADTSQQVPSADEIGAEFERFLAERDRTEE